ncbi:MAG: glutamate--tRNA ligase [Ginsengibacter sp.]
MSKVRVRFAPSPTGGLHLGGVRTVLFNYLFAKQHDGEFVLRIEDTDQNRYVVGAEDYIYKCLEWCGLTPDESPLAGGPYAPYRQSERKNLYKKYAEELIANGHAYYAFDLPEELEAMREQLKAANSDSLQYDHLSRGKMKNSLSLSEDETKRFLQSGTPYVIRLKIEPDQHITFTDLIRGEVEFETNHVDDKVLLKADGMPTYHLAVVVDDYLMKITHAFRGEEWLPSAPAHILLWQYLDWQKDMPQWGHLPLILKPDGNGKLSKRDGARLGFPVFAMNWNDAKSGEVFQGFKELGFLPEAFVNMLAMLGWNDGSEQEIFTIQELVTHFSIDRVHKAGAKFDFEKAKWFNHEWLKKTDAEKLLPLVKNIFENEKIVVADDTKLSAVVRLTKERCVLLTDFIEQAGYFFVTPKAYDAAAISSKWDKTKTIFFNSLTVIFSQSAVESTAAIEEGFKKLADEQAIKVGELQMLFRVMLVGSKKGPAVFEIAHLLGVEETNNRITHCIKTLNLS